MFQLYRDRQLMVLGIIFANIALSIWSISLDSIINNDGITYLAMAELYIEGDWHTANGYYNWPVYPLLIAGVSKITGVDVTYSAHALNTFFAITLSLAFVAVVGELSNNNRRVLLIAAIVILLLPSITKYRAYIIRDFAYLSLYLWSLYFLFRFCNTRDKKHLIGWLLGTGASCLFRFEGIILLFVAPYFLLMFAGGQLQHRRKILLSLSVIILTAAGLSIYWYLERKYASSITLAQQAGGSVSNIFDLFLLNVSEQFGSSKGDPFSYFATVLKNVGGVLYDLVRRMAVFFFFLGCYAFHKNLGLSNSLVKRIWLVYFCFNFAILVSFSLLNNLQVSRYTMATALTLLILTPFALDRIIDSIASLSKIRRVGAYLLFLLLIFISIDGLDVRTKKRHFHDASHWLIKNMPEDTNLYSNDRLIVHYADLGPRSNFKDQYSTEQLVHHINSGRITMYDYVAVSVTGKSGAENVARQTMMYAFGHPETIIEGQEGRSVFIFKTDDPKIPLGR